MSAASQPNAVHPRISGALIVILGLMVVSVAINYIDRTSLSTAAPLLEVDLAISPSKMGMPSITYKGSVVPLIVVVFAPSL